MKIKRILAIIDLQKPYLDKIDYRVANEMIDYVCNLIRLQKYDLIVNVSYSDYWGRTTNPKIREALRNVPNVLHMNKEQNDGSWEINQAVLAKGYNIRNCKIEVVGVNTDACVLHTVRGLRYDFVRDYKNIFVHEKGTATASGLHYAEIALNKLMLKDMKVNIIREEPEWIS